MSTLNSGQLSLKDIRVQVGEKLILADLSIDLAPRQIYTIIGPSGAGKSTLLRLLAGLKEPDGGELLLDGQPFIPKEHVITLVPQDYGLLPWQTAKQAVVKAIKLTAKGYDQAAEARVTRLFQQLGLTGEEKKYPKALSGGQQQRVALARAFAVKGDLLLMDEPFSALDAFTREKIQELFIAAWQEQPQLTCFITHDIEEALLLGHQIVVLSGKPGKISRVMENPLRDITDLDQRRTDPRMFQWLQTLRKEIWHEES